MPPKKAKTPPPPRRAQGPQRRTDTRSADDRNRLILYALAASGIVALVVVLGLFAFGGDEAGAKSVANAMEDAGCTYRNYKEQPPTHYQTLPPKKAPKYNSNPPSSGPHYVETVTYGFYEEPVERYSLIHNLEHGAVVVQWGDDVGAAQVDEIREWWEEDPRGIVAAPLPALGDEIAITAWTHQAKCTTWSSDAVEEFEDAFRFKGPERFDPATMDPGSQ